MIAAARAHTVADATPSRRLLRAGLLVAAVDGLFATAFGVFYRGVPAARVWQGVASVLLGKDALTGGTSVIATGLLMHVAVAFTWSALFLLAVTRSHNVRAILDSPYGALRIATVLGPLIWVCMSLAVIPTLVHRMPPMNSAWVAMLVGHVFFVGLPMAWGIGSGSR